MVSGIYNVTAETVFGTPRPMATSLFITQDGK